MIHRIAVLGAALLMTGSACSDDDGVVSTIASVPPSSLSATTTTEEPVTTTTTATTSTTTTTLATTSTTVTRTTPSTVAPDDYPVVDPPEADLVASDLEAETGCDQTDPSVGFALLGWRPAPGGDVQRVQVTADARGFEGDLVVTGAELGGEVDAVRWLQLEGQAVHSWRVITASPDRSVWYASAVAQFEGPLCAVDYQDG